MEKKELPLLVEVYLSGYRNLEKYAYSSPGRVKSYLRWLWKGDPEGFLVAENEKGILGFISVHSEWRDWEEGRCGEIHEIVVREEFKRKGIGKSLFLAAIEYLRRRGHSKITLWVGKENRIARQWYRRLGFEEVYIVGEWVRMKKIIATPL